GGHPGKNCSWPISAVCKAPLTSPWVYDMPLTSSEAITRPRFQPHGNLQQRRCSMEMAYRERWRAEIAELQRILSGFDLREECKWGKPCYTMDGKNIVIIQGSRNIAPWASFRVRC